MSRCTHGARRAGAAARSVRPRSPRWRSIRLRSVRLRFARLRSVRLRTVRLRSTSVAFTLLILLGGCASPTPRGNHAARRQHDPAHVAALGGSRAPASQPAAMGGSRTPASQPGALSGDQASASQAAAPIAEDPAAAVTRASDLDLFALLRAAEQLNPEIAAARENYHAAGGLTLQAGLLPNPTLRLKAEEIPENDFALEKSIHTIGILQPLLLGGRRQAEVDAADAEENVRLLRLEATRRAVFADLRAAHAEALALRAAVTAHEELLAIAQRTYEVARSRFDARAVPENEVIRAELEVHELQLGARTLTRDADALLARLQALLGGVELRLEQLAGAAPSAPSSLPDVLFTHDALEENPELLAARAAVQAADRRLEAAEARSTPDMSFGLAYGHDRNDRGIIEAGLNFALPVFDRNQGRIREARHLAARARREADVVRGQLEAQLAEALAAHGAARDRVDTFRERIVPASERALGQLRESYSAGRTDMLDLLDAQRSNARARLSLIQGLRESGAAEARLWALVGLDVDLHEPSTTPSAGTN